MKKYFFIFLLNLLFINAFASNSVSEQKQIDEVNNNLVKSQNLNIDLKSSINKTKILFLEPCNVTKVSLDKDGNASDNINDFVDNDFTTKEVDDYDKYSGISVTQKKFIDTLISKIKRNLDKVGLFDFKYESNVCGKIDEFMFNNDESLEDYILNTYNKDNDYVIVNSLTYTEEGKLKLELFVWDMLDRRIVGAQYYILNEKTISRISNIISDFIYVNTTDESIGIFDTKIIYVSETGRATARKKAIKIMDFNGDNSKKITDGSSIVITPTFSRMNKDEIFYLEYKNKKANFFKENVETGQKSVIKVVDGIIYAPSFNPKNSSQIVLSIANESGTNLYLLDMNAGKYSKITNNEFINTSPNFSPDGTKVVYVSDKTSIKKLYVYDTDTRTSEKISKNNGSYDKPVWSPDGRLIAFVKIEGGMFKLGLMTPDGENERYIASSYLIEGLRWSPNSRYILFSKQETPYGKNSIPHIYMIDILTNQSILISSSEEEGAVDPDWVSY